MKHFKILLPICVLLFGMQTSKSQEAGNALLYDGIDEYTSFGNPVSMQLPEYSITLWFYAEDNTRSILTRGSSQGPNNSKTFDLYGDGTDLILFLNSNGGLGHTHVIGNFQMNQWNHVAISYSDSVITTLLNGDNYTRTSTPFLEDVTTYGWDLGGNGAYTFKGKIDEFRLWSYARDGDTYRDKMHARYYNWSGLVGSYNFNASSGSNLDDLDSPDDDGTNMNMEDADWVTSYAPMGNYTSRSQREQRGIWQATGTDEALDSDGFFLQVNSPLNENQYATYGNDNIIGLNSLTTDDVPLTIEKRILETWYIDEFGSASMNPTFDLNRLVGSELMAGNAAGYCLLYRDSTVGAFTKLNQTAIIIGTTKIQFQNVPLQDGYYTLATCDLANSPLVPEFIVGQSYFGANDYIEYIPGDLPILIVAPHGGTLDTDHLPIVHDRGTDGGSQLSSFMTMDSITEYTEGCRPHVIINHLRPRHFMGVGNMIYSSGGHQEANQAWSDFQNFIESAKTKTVDNWGAGHYFDMHTTARPRNQIGMGISGTELNNPDSVLMNMAGSSTVNNICTAGGADFLEFIKGDDCFGSVLQDDGWDSTPSWDNLAPTGAFFYAGRNTWRHGSNSIGTIDATHVESSAGYVNSAANRPHYSASVARAMIKMMEVFYGFTLDCSTNSIEENEALSNLDVFPNPIQKGEKITFSTVEIVSEITLFTIAGEKVSAPILLEGYLPNNLKSGVYLMNLKLDSGHILTKRIVLL